ncbi:glutathione S-transferase [Microvirga tunisiensis]|uniref:Glutathione S-transferase n=2 Tax=Pannonibacter tanglangensis TaxID=2750084 RepID=A0ABW9ZRI0_9HYPH|nr:MULTISPECIES: glutathione S-transferase family protein [unclassified Pannonibacter]NBN65564.1 glutathione S-transferase [Pannonibacter sp. XCT-34]NBN80209.1 glutathione S-transferase [Pannonibacter sp. XCT-53]
MYKVIGNPRSRSARIYWMLEELGQPYEIVPAKPHSPEVLALNPGGKIPILIDGDAVLTDSVAIVQYLADKHGACTFPAGTVNRAIQDSFTQFCVDEVEGALWTAAKQGMFYENRAPQMQEICQGEFGKAMETLAQRLGDKPYVMGDTFTVPDLILGHCGGWAAMSRFPMPKDGPLYDYFKRLRERPAYGAMGKRVAEALK